MPSLVEQALQAKVPGRLYVSPGEALSLVPGGTPRHAENAAYQRILRGTFPFPTRLVGGRRVVSILDIARSVTDEMDLPTAAQRRGRRRKTAAIAP